MSFLDKVRNWYNILLWLVCHKKSCPKIYYYRSNTASNSVWNGNNNRAKSGVIYTTTSRASNRVKSEAGNRA